ncbi:MAG: hypothetical protein ACI84D_002359 [Thalassolituus oleivorans]|jgi:hypothetical protein
MAASTDHVTKRANLLSEGWNTRLDPGKDWTWVGLRGRGVNPVRQITFQSQPELKTRKSFSERPKRPGGLVSSGIVLDFAIPTATRSLLFGTR